MSVIVTHNGNTVPFPAGVRLAGILLVFDVTFGKLQNKFNPTIEFIPNIGDKASTYQHIPEGEYIIVSEKRLPPLVPRTESSDIVIYSYDQPPTSISTGTFRCLEGVTPEPIFSLWSELSENGLNCTEHSIQSLVTTVLKAYFSMLGLHNKLECVAELSVFQIHPDIWTVRSSEHGLPIGVVMVKKPTATFDTKQVGSELYDYLLRLQTFYGLKFSFGIFTTYEIWQLFWLADTNTYAESTLITTLFPPPFIKADKCEEVNSAPNEARIMHQITERPMYATPPIRFDSPDLSKTILSVLLKMYNSPFDQVAEMSNERPYVIINAEKWYWGKVSWTTNTLNYHKIPPDNCSNYILLRDLRGGSDGRVWMACSPSGLVCVLKFGKLVLDSSVAKAVRDAKEKLEIERKYYARQDSDIITRVTTLAGRPVLVMRHYHLVDLSVDENQLKVRKAIKNLAENRLMHHKDLKPEHIVIDTPNDRIIFIDMARVDDISPDDDINSIITSMMNKINL